MFVNGVPFLVSVARGLNLVTTKFTPSRTAKQLAAGITLMIEFQVGTVLMDNEFEKLQNLVPILAINKTAVKEHVPKVKRKIRLIKERGRGILNTLLFKKMHRLMLIELVYHMVLWLNAFPTNSGVSETLSPRKIVYRHKLDFAMHCKSPFWMYCEVQDEPAPTNTMVTLSTPAILLGPTGNLQGTYKFLSLATRKKVKRCAFTLYPMPDLVIKKVNEYGKSTALPGFLSLPTGTASFLNGTRKWTSFPKESLTLRTSSSTLPSLWNTQEWCSGKINPFHRLRRSTSLKGEPRMLWLSMPTSSSSTSQEWRQQRSYTPTRTNSTTTKLTMTTTPSHSPSSQQH
jgi:hypothetical protein